MKNQIVRTFALLGLLLIMAVSGVKAQRVGKVEANIPFDFTAGRAKVKAGAYSLKQTYGNALVISTAEEKAIALINAPLVISSRDSKGGSRLVFNRYGDQYFLAQVWLNADLGRQLFISEAEMKAARAQKLTNLRVKPERVQIAMRVR